MIANIAYSDIPLPHQIIDIITKKRIRPDVIDGIIIPLICHEEEIKHAVKFNDSMFNLLIVFLKLSSLQHVSMLFTITSLQKLAKVSNVRHLLNCMELLDIIKYEDTEDGIIVYLKFYSTFKRYGVFIKFEEPMEKAKMFETIRSSDTWLQMNKTDRDNTVIKLLDDKTAELITYKNQQFSYIPEYFLSDAFLSLPLGQKKLLLYLLKKSYQMSKNKNRSVTILQNNIMVELGIMNRTRLFHYLEECKDILNLDMKIEKKPTYDWKQSYDDVSEKYRKKRIRMISTKYLITLPVDSVLIQKNEDIINDNDVPIENKHLPVKKNFRINYLKEFLKKICNIEISDGEDTYQWLDFLKDCGHISLVKIANIVGNSRVINKTSSYFYQIAISHDYMYTYA